MAKTKIEFWNNMESDFYHSNFKDPAEYLKARGVRISQKTKKYISKWIKNA